MFRAIVWGLVLGALASLVVLSIVYVRILPFGASPKNWFDSWHLFVPPGLAGGLLLGVAAGIVRKRRRLWLLLLALGLYPLLAVGTVAVLGDWYAWQMLVVALFTAVAYFPIVFLPVSVGVLLLERLTRPTEKSESQKESGQQRFAARDSLDHATTASRRIGG